MGRKTINRWFLMFLRFFFLYRNLYTRLFFLLFQYPLIDNRVLWWPLKNGLGVTIDPGFGQFILIQLNNPILWFLFLLFFLILGPLLVFQFFIYRVPDSWLRNIRNVVNETLSRSRVGRERKELFNDQVCDLKKMKGQLTDSLVVLYCIFLWSFNSDLSCCF